MYDLIGNLNELESEARHKDAVRCAKRFYRHECHNSYFNENDGPYLKFRDGKWSFYQEPK